MSPATHAGLVRAFNLAILFIGLPVFLMLGCAAMSGDAIPVFVLIAVIAIISIALWLIPVHCSSPDCQGMMTKSSTQISSYKARLGYRCSACGASYEAVIFHMPPADPLP